jgi:hypothetical protein
VGPARASKGEKMEMGMSVHDNEKKAVFTLSVKSYYVICLCQG